jgi:Methyltransferase domain
MNFPPQTVLAANRVAFDSIEGWVGDRIFHIVDFIKLYHEQQNIHGDIAEIGVHHGKLFVILAAVARSDEMCIAVDLFENQRLNVDSSGNGSKNVFESHIRTHFPELLDRVRIVACDSMSITPSTASAKLSERGIRLFSIDGGHTIAHVVNDLSIAQEVLVSSGVVLLDDFLGPMWPSVSEGFFNYMSIANRRLAPILIFQNKLFLTTFSEHDQALRALRDYLDRTVGAEIHNRWRYSLLCGFSVLCFA